MNRYQQTERLATELAREMERGVRNPDRLWIFCRWLRRPKWRDSGYAAYPSDIKPYDLTLQHQMEYALEHVTPADLRRQVADLNRAVRVE